MAATLPRQPVHPGWMTRHGWMSPSSPSSSGSGFLLFLLLFEGLLVLLATLLLSHMSSRVRSSHTRSGHMRSGHMSSHSHMTVVGWSTVAVGLLMVT